MVSTGSERAHAIDDLSIGLVCLKHANWGEALTDEMILKTTKRNTYICMYVHTYTDADSRLCSGRCCSMWNHPYSVGTDVVGTCRVCMYMHTTPNKFKRRRKKAPAAASHAQDVFSRYLSMDVTFFSRPARRKCSSIKMVDGPAWARMSMAWNPSSVVYLCTEASTEAALCVH